MAMSETVTQSTTHMTAAYILWPAADCSLISLWLLSLFARSQGYIRIYLSDGTFTTLPITSTTTAWQACLTIAKKQRLREQMQQRNVAFTSAPLTSTSRHAQPQHYQDIDDNIHIDESTTDSPAATPTAASSKTAHLSPKQSNSAKDAAGATEDDYSWLHDYALFLHHNSDPHSHNDRRVSEHEQLITLLHHLQQQGQTAQYRLYFKQLAAVNDSDEDDETLQAEEKEEAEEDAAQQLYLQQCKRFHAQHVGYLDRRMSGSSWKERWFVLQQSKLYTYKSHTSNPLTPLSSISIADSIIAPLPLYSSLSLTSPTGGVGGGGSCFEINTQQKIYYFRTKTAQSMDEWIVHLRQHTRVERDNEDIERLQFDIEKVAAVESAEDERRRREMSVGVEGVLTDESGCEWLCKLAMEQRQTRELLCWMDVQVWFFVQRRSKIAEGAGMYGGGAGSVSGGGTGPNSRRGSIGDGSGGGRRDSVAGEFRRRRASSSSASIHSVSPPSPGGSNNSSSPARSGSLMRRPSINAATLTYFSSTPPNAPIHNHKLTRRRSSSSASSAGHLSHTTVPPSSYLPTLSTTLIYSRYIEPGSEMEVDVPEQVQLDYQELLAPPSPSQHASEQQLNEHEEQVMHELEAALREKIAEQLYAAWQLDCMQYALMRLPVAGGTMYAHHPWRFVLRERRREEREEREREEEDRRREEEEEAELRRRMEHVKRERRRSASGFIRSQRADEDAEEQKAVSGGVSHSRRASLTHRVASKALLI